MGIRGTSSDELKAVLTQLSEHGYAVIEGVLDEGEIRHYRSLAEELFARERRQPFEPEDGPALPGDDEIEAYLKESYEISDAEQARLMRRIRHTRAQNQGTPWPVPPAAVVKNFLHLPTLFDHDRSQRIWNVLNKAPDFGKLIEHPVVLSLVRELLGDDCVLADCSATSIGPHTDEGGAWHVDVPLGQFAGAVTGLSADHSERLDARCLHGDQRGDADRSRQPSHAQKAQVGRTAGERNDADRARRIGRCLAFEYLAPIGTERDRRSAASDSLLLLPLLDQAVYRLYVNTAGDRPDLLAGVAVSAGILGERIGARVEITWQSGTGAASR